MKKQLFAVITKVDEEKREVSGILAEEAIDKDNEIFDYATSKPYFEKWNAEFSEKTDGKSVGNLRAMHLKIAAGKFVTMDYDDSTKKVEVTAKVVNDDEWKNVCEGVYTGFSIGARIVGKKWKDAASGAWRWTADPYEGSLVDNPCMYGATFSRVCADGVKATKFTGSDATREKGLYTVGYFANIVAQLAEISDYMTYEESAEDDSAGAKLAAQIRVKAKELGDLLVKYTKNEVEEATADKETVDMSNDPKNAAKKVVAEAGVRPTQNKDAAPDAAAPAVAEEPKTAAELKAQREALDKQIAEAEAKEAPAAPAAAAEPAKEATVAELAKTVGELQTKFTALEKSANEKLTKAEGVNAELTETLTKANAALKEASEKLSKAQNRPIPTPVNVKGVVVEKKDDKGSTAEGEKKEVTKDDTPMSAIQKIHAAGPQQAR